MKKALTLIMLSAFTIGAFTQAPQKMSYQAVIRDAGNALITNHIVGIRISIIKDSAEGIVVYTETQAPSTNDNGLISIEIGTETGFDTIEWSRGPYFIKIETDPEGGTNYTAITGITQILSVPYALHSQTATVAQSVEGSISNNIYPPSATVLPATDINPNSAVINAQVNGQGFLTDVAFQWGLSTSYGNSVTPSQSPITGSSDINVNAIIGGLQPAATYHYRIKASNAVNVIYSGDMTFTTKMVVTASITSVTTNSAVSGGTVVHDGGSAVTARGVCWSTEPDPTLEDNYTVDDSGTGTFVSSLTGLTNSTLYFVRAYATNSSGTFYGDTRTLITFYNTVSDYEGNTYGTVLLGTQEWMGENLRTTHYNNGLAIGFPGNDNEAWSNDTEGAYAWYENDISWKNIYGALYNMYAVANENKLCPTGWHVPGNAEWSTLVEYIGGSATGGGKLKSTATLPDPHPRWFSPNVDATNEYGFYGIPGGSRSDNGTYYGMGGSAYFWTTSQFYTGISYLRMLAQLSGDVKNPYSSHTNGYSVRCVKD